MNDDLISRQAVFEQINCWIGSGEYRYTNATDYLNKRIKALQAVNPQEPTWVTGSDGAKIAFKDVPAWKVTKICEILADVVEAEEDQEPSNDAISRHAVKELYYKCGYIDFRKICELPSVNPQPICEDAISRQKVLDVINLNWDYRRNCIRAIEKLPPVNPQEPKWIPVSERLPEENGQYLITVKYKPEADYENIYAEHGEWIDGQWDMFCFGHCGEVEDIVAWMPLPKPYKAESEVNT